MSLSVVLGNVLAGLSILVIIGGGVRWIIKKYLSELVPNSGTSIHDKINLEIIPMLKELRADQVIIGEKVAKLEGRFEQHVDEAIDL